MAGRAGPHQDVRLGVRRRALRAARAEALVGVRGAGVGGRGDGGVRDEEWVRGVVLRELGGGVRRGVVVVLQEVDGALFRVDLGAAAFEAEEAEEDADDKGRDAADDAA